MNSTGGLSRIWSLPQWVHYVLAIVACAVVTAFRIAMSTVSADRIQYLFFTFGVCIAALMGGLGPGLLAAALSLLIGTTLLPRIYAHFSGPDPVVIFSFLALWTFISILCDVLRKAASGYRVTSLQRDEKEHILNAFLQQTSDGLLTIDKRGTIKLSNESFGEMVGVNAGDLLGTSVNYLSKFLTAAPDWAALFAEAQKEGRATIDLETVGKRWLHFRIFPDQHESCSIFVQDATVQKGLELNQLQMLAAERHARSQAEEANRLKDGFLAMLSHELRTPLTSILGWTELLSPQVVEGSMLSEGLTAILKSTQTQKSLIDQLLDMSRITTGKMLIERHLLDVDDVVSEAVNGMLPTARAKDIELTFVGLDSPCVMLGDESRLIQILNNLITNAIKFSPPGSKVLVTVTLEGPGSVLIRVKDEGEGISPDLLPVIFDPFQQADSSITRQHGGLGLGLALAKQLTLQHDGKIRALSEGPGKGSTFEISLPIQGTMKVREVSQQEQSQPNTLVGAVVLLVEDDESTRSVLEVVLRQAGATVFSAESGQVALDILSKHDISIMVSDIGMPMMDGYELIRQVRGHSLSRISNILAISLSAFAFREDVDAAMKAGFDGCLTKPVTASTLVRELALRRLKTSN